MVVVAVVVQIYFSLHSCSSVAYAIVVHINEPCAIRH